MDGFGDEIEGALAAGLHHEGVAAGEKDVHERQEFAGVEHGFTAGELDEPAGGEGFDLGQDFFMGEGLAAGEGVLGVTPGTAEIAAGEADEDAGQAAKLLSPWTDL